jgi:D-arginine dehydrogenase
MNEGSSDFLVIGAGMAGAAVAAHLAEHAKVQVLEMEDHPGYHSTGRSAALFSENYGNTVIRALSKASRSHFFSPADDASLVPLVTPRQVLVFARRGQEEALAAYSAHGPSMGGDRMIGSSEAFDLCPVLRMEGLVGAYLDPRAADIEVHELHQSYLRQFRARGGHLTTGAKVIAITHSPQGWTIECEDESYRAGVVINAAGAWAGEIGRMAGAHAIGMQPMRRTAAIVETDIEISKSWPMMLDVNEQFYAKPDAGLLLVSPADETPSPPCDAYPEEFDVAVAIDRLQEATTLTVRRIKSRWAGLRSFVEDRTPVVGFDTQRANFFWLAALGGYGIQTAPALSRLAASLALRRPIDADIEDFGVSAADLSPGRLCVEPAHAGASGRT